jgi:hypothetical protein
MRKFSLLLMFVSGGSAMAAHFDPPDLSFEYELHRQYMKSPGKKSPGMMTDGGRRSRDGMTESYRIRGGDTLWSLSRMLYGDGHFWPRVWSQNRDISNPHLIRPGHTLQFLMGSEDDTPAFRITEDDDDSGLELASSNSSQPVIEIPPSEFRPKPVIRIPGSFPQWQSVFRSTGGEVIDDHGIELKLEKIPDRLYLSGYVQETPLQAIGIFEETDVEAELPIANQYVYLRLKRGTATPGQTVLIARQDGQIEEINPQWKKDSGLHIYHIQITGEAEITERVPSREDDKEHESFRALLTKTTGLNVRGNAIIHGRLETVDLSHNGSPGSATAQIIGSERHSASVLYGPGDIVFLSKGSREGLEVGHILNVYSDRTIRARDTSVAFSPVASGKVKVVRVTDHLATAVVLESRDALQQGDRVQEVSRRDNGNGAMDLKDHGVSDDEEDLESLPADGEDQPEDDLTDELRDEA